MIPFSKARLRIVNTRRPGCSISDKACEIPWVWHQTQTPSLQQVEAAPMAALRF
jgi:hypothetical protein